MKKIAIPQANGKLAMHFGHCESFALVEVDMDAKKIINVSAIDSPPHEPGLLPRFLAEKGANMIIAGGMGNRAQNLFTENGIEVLVGAPAESPEDLVNSFLSGSLATGVNMCDH
jgi:predicted Fe-Mo cluster-binding NifX family protein